MNTSFKDKGKFEVVYTTRFTNYLEFSSFISEVHPDDIIAITETNHRHFTVVLRSQTVYEYKTPRV